MLLFIEQSELVLDDSCVPFNQVNDPSEENGGAFVEFRQMLKKKNKMIIVAQFIESTYIGCQMLVEIVEDLNHSLDQTLLNLARVKQY